MYEFFSFVIADMIFWSSPHFALIHHHLRFSCIQEGPEGALLCIDRDLSYNSEQFSAKHVKVNCY